MPFALRGIDTDKGSEFINDHCIATVALVPSSSRADVLYKKDDNAHIEQKNWTHVRELVGYDRYDSPAALAALNALYADLRLLQNLWQRDMGSLKRMSRRKANGLCTRYARAVPVGHEQAARA